VDSSCPGSRSRSAQGWKKAAIDVFVNCPIEFDSLWRDSLDVPLDAVSIRVASIAHLISTKQIAGGPQDVADIEQPQLLVDGQCTAHAAMTGTYEDAAKLRRWSFRQRTPQQRLDWLVSMLRIAYQTGALTPRHPPTASRETES
jgi:hypothetical protein